MPMSTPFKNSYYFIIQKKSMKNGIITGIFGIFIEILFTCFAAYLSKCRWLPRLQTLFQCVTRVTLSLFDRVIIYSEIM